MQAAGVQPGSVERSAMSRMDSFGRLPAAAASRCRSKSASQEYTGRGRSVPTRGLGPGDKRSLLGLLKASADGRAAGAKWVRVTGERAGAVGSATLAATACGGV